MTAVKDSAAPSRVWEFTYEGS